MTTPNERTRAVIQTQAFLLDIHQDPSLPEAIRQEAKRLLRHYPSRGEMQRAGELEEHASEGTLFSPLLCSATAARASWAPCSQLPKADPKLLQERSTQKAPKGAEHVEAKWPAWLDSDDISEDAFTNGDRPLDRLKGTVRRYDRPFEPTGVADGDVHDNAAISAVVTRTVPNIAAEWGLSHCEMAALLGMEEAEYRSWSDAPGQAALDPDQIERASFVLGIYKALALLFPSPERQRRWLQQPNQGAPFQGDAPLDRLRHGGVEGLRTVRGHLDAVCQDGFRD